MTKGKLAAQCAHAAVALCEEIIMSYEPQGDLWRGMMKNWEANGAKKIVLRIDSEAEM